MPEQEEKDWYTPDKKGGYVTTTEMPVAKYRKRLLQSCGIGFIGGGILVGLGFTTTLYLDLLTAIGIFFVSNPVIDVLMIGAVSVIVYVGTRNGKKPKKQQKVASPVVIK